MSIAELSPAGQIARAHDPDRFLCALFAPAEHREALFLLIAFNHELVRALEMGGGRSDTGPLASLIRLQWWREVIEGEPRRHELAEPVGRAVVQGRLDRGALLGIIEAREAEAEGIETLETWRMVQLGGPGGMQVATAMALGVRDPAMLHRLRSGGAAYGAGAMLRWLPALLHGERAILPPQEGAAFLAAQGTHWLAEAGMPRPGRTSIGCIMPLVLARRDLARSPDPRPRGLGDRLALTAAWLRGGP